MIFFFFLWGREYNFKTSSILGGELLPFLKRDGWAVKILRHSNGSLKSFKPCLRRGVPVMLR